LSGSAVARLFNNRLIIENKFSKQGYHKSKTAKYGDMELLVLIKFIIVIEVINDNK
jgi:hypothetical protein